MCQQPPGGDLPENEEHMAPAKRSPMPGLLMGMMCGIRAGDTFASDVSQIWTIIERVEQSERDVICAFAGGLADIAGRSPPILACAKFDDAPAVEAMKPMHPL